MRIAAEFKARLEAAKRRRTRQDISRDLESIENSARFLSNLVGKGDVLEAIEHARNSADSLPERATQSIHRLNAIPPNLPQILQDISALAGAAVVTSGLRGRRGNLASDWRIRLQPIPWLIVVCIRLIEVLDGQQPGEGNRKLETYLDHIAALAGLTQQQAWGRQIRVATSQNIDFSEVGSAHLSDRLAARDLVSELLAALNAKPSNQNDRR